MLRVTAKIAQDTTVQEPQASWDALHALQAPPGSIVAAGGPSRHCAQPVYPSFSPFLPVVGNPSLPRARIQDPDRSTEWKR